MTRTLTRYLREAPAALALGVVIIAMAIAAPAFFSPENLRDIALNNAPVLLVAIGMTLVILVGEIDISVASQFAVCSVIAGVAAKAGVPILLLPALVIIAGALMGAVNGWLVGILGLPSIIVTLAMLVAWRDLLRWITEGAWVQDLPSNFQWFGLSAAAAQILIVLLSVAILGLIGWLLRNHRVGRNVYAVGSDAEAARLAGIDSQRVTFMVFTITGALVGLGAMLNAVRFTSVPSNAGTGFELQAVAAVVVGGTAITGGRGSVAGTLIGVVLLGTIGTSMSYVGISPFWARAIQGAIILAALMADASIARLLRSRARTSRDAIAV